MKTGKTKLWKIPKSDLKGKRHWELIFCIKWLKWLKSTLSAKLSLKDSWKSFKRSSLSKLKTNLALKLRSWTEWRKSMRGWTSWTKLSASQRILLKAPTKGRGLNLMRNRQAAQKMTKMSRNSCVTPQDRSYSPRKSCESSWGNPTRTPSNWTW